MGNNLKETRKEFSADTLQSAVDLAVSRGVFNRFSMLEPRSEGGQFEEELIQYFDQLKSGVDVLMNPESLEHYYRNHLRRIISNGIPRRLLVVDISPNRFGSNVNSSDTGKNVGRILEGHLMTTFEEQQWGVDVARRDPVYFASLIGIQETTESYLRASGKLLNQNYRLWNKVAMGHLLTFSNDDNWLKAQLAAAEIVCRVEEGRVDKPNKQMFAEGSDLIATYKGNSWRLLSWQRSEWFTNPLADLWYNLSRGEFMEMIYDDIEKHPARSSIVKLSDMAVGRTES